MARPPTKEKPSAPRRWGRRHVGVRRRVALTREGVPRGRGKQPTGAGGGRRGRLGAGSSILSRAAEGHSGRRPLPRTAPQGAAKIVVVLVTHVCISPVRRATGASGAASLADQLSSPCVHGPDVHLRPTHGEGRVRRSLGGKDRTRGGVNEECLGDPGSAPAMQRPDEPIQTELCAPDGARRKLARRELRIQSEIMCNEKTLSFIPEPQPVYRLVVVLRAG